MNKYVEYFKKVSIETSKLSTCASKAVGAVLVKNNRILAISYNGVVSKAEHCNKIFDAYELYTKEYEREIHHKWSLNNEIHAEQNLISFCAKNGISTKNTELYITLEPCITCSKLITASGITKVYFINYYDKSDNQIGLKFLKNNNILVEKI